MMHLLIPVFSPATSTWGGLTRVIAIAKAAQQAGHRVAFCASGDLSSTLKQRGFHVYSVPPAALFGLPAPFSRVLAKRSQQVTPPVKPGRDLGNIWFFLLLPGMDRTRYLKRLVEAERRAAQYLEANLIFTNFDPGAYLLAKIGSLPVAAAYQTPMAHGIRSLPWKLRTEYHHPIPEGWGAALGLPGPIFERRFNARQVQEAGVGLMGEVNEFTAEWIAKALENQAACAAKAIQLGKRICSYGGAGVAVLAMKGWVLRGARTQDDHRDGKP